MHNYQSIALVDLSYLFRRNYMGAGVGAAPNAGATRTLDDIALIAGDVDHMILCLDKPPYRRRDKYEPYKAQREEPQPEELGQKRALIAEIKRRGYVTASAKGYEADDIIATLATSYGPWCGDVRIVASDKDAAQLINENVTQYIPAVGTRPAERRDSLKCLAKFNVYPDQMVLYQALVGDSTDNVPGVKGVGPAKAAQVIAELVEAGRPATLVALAEHLAGRSGASKAGASWTAIATHWEDLRISYELVALDRQAPIDPEGLLVKLEANAYEPAAPEEIELEQFVGNGPTMPGFEPTHTPMPESNERRVARANVTPKGKAPTEQEVDEMQATIAAGNSAEKTRQTVLTEAPPAANETRLEVKVAPPASPDVTNTYAIARAKDEAQLGIVNNRLQPTCLRSAWTISKWIAASGLYKAFDTPEKVFAVIQRGCELGLDAGTALLGFHVIEGKPTASADLIRALAERSPDCEYFRWISADDTQATWETKHRKHPEATRFTYTIEQAMKVPEYWRKDRWGGPPNWEKRPQEMLTKTAGTKLARLVYASAVMGLYCPEEMGYIDTTAVAA